MPSHTSFLNIQPADISKDMQDVRAGVDAIDDALVTLIAKRFSYMDAAARIKAERGAVRDEARKAEVIANVKAKATELGIPADLVEQMWEQLVERSISYELDAWDMRNPE